MASITPHHFPTGLRYVVRYVKPGSRNKHRKVCPTRQAAEVFVASLPAKPVRRLVGGGHTTAERIMRRTSLGPGGCWLWQGQIDRYGYGRLSPMSPGDSTLAHRRAYATFVAPLVDGLTIDHLCSVRSCVNPNHLDQVTIAENLRRSPNTPAGRKARALSHTTSKAVAR